MNPMLDYCFTPARQQTIAYAGIKKWLWRIKKILQQKGDPDLILCACELCNKQIRHDKAYTAELIYMQGTIIRKKTRQYCCKQCAEQDRMAHELY
ncbi:TPA: hypothetical protein JZG64_000747 [Escherichia coli]|nr:hypothetical protein [Escherichia coli]HAX5182869.1 hypothetical protein [Escherichia coli]HAX5229604.1 hypothetical protein [Escherichia coli]